MRALTTTALFLALTLGAASTAALGAADVVAFANVLPNGSLMSKKMVTMRGRKFENLVRQNTDFSCGAAALATILRHGYGQNTDERRVMAGLLEVSDAETVRRYGFSLLDLKHYLEQLGMRGRGYNVSVERLADIKVPVIVLLDLKGYRHFVVFRAARDGLVHVADPALGNREMPVEDFIQAWNGVIFAVIGQGFQHDSVLANPSAPLSVDKLVAIRAASERASALDFGIRHANFF